MLHTKTVAPQLFCVDTGAQRSCIEFKQYKRILNAHSPRGISVHPSCREFRFEDQILKLLTMIELALETLIDIRLVPVLMNIVS